MLNLFKIIIFLQLIFSPEMKADDTKDTEIVRGYETKCVLPSPVDNGKYSISSSTTWNFIELTPGDLVESGTNIIHECNNGYYADSIPIDICHDGKWEERFRGCIKNKNCDLPEFPQNGNYEATGFSMTTVKPGQQVAEFTMLKFSCAPLYDLLDDKKLVCIAGAWTSDPPTCKRSNKCVLPDPPANGRYELIGSNITVLAGEIVEDGKALYYSCDSGYSLKNGIITYCHNGSWIGGPLECKESNICVVPDPPENGRSELMSSNITALAGEIVEEGTTLNYNCDPGYSQKHMQMTYCHNGFWIGGPVECKRSNVCVVPDSPENGRSELISSNITALAGEIVEEGTTLNYNCDPGYSQKHMQMTYCHNGSWIGGPVECKRSNGCVLPDPPANGRYELFGSNVTALAGEIVEVGKALYYSCDSGYSLKNGIITYCHSGSWIGGPLECKERNGCVVPDPPENARSELIGSNITAPAGEIVEEGTTLNYNCDPGYSQKHMQMTYCHNGFWIGGPVECKRSNGCVVPDPPEYGRFELIGSNITALAGEIVEEGTTLNYNCDPGYSQNDRQMTYCHNGSWIGGPVECKKSNVCVVPDPPENGRSELIGSNITALAGEIVKEGTTLNYNCDPGYSQNDMQMTYCHNGSWIGRPAECKRRNKCVLPDPPANGRYELIGSNITVLAGEIVEVGKALYYSCDPGYSLKDGKVTYCHNGSWIGGPVECKDSRIFKDCSDVSGYSGVYNIKPNEQTGIIAVYCELNLDKKSWTVIQQRFDGSVDFYRDFESYKQFFGDAQGNYWIGLENMHQITKNEDHELYVELETHDGHKASARYKIFSVGPACWGYKLTVYSFDDRSGADDALYSNNGYKFSTFDNDQDMLHDVNCAERLHGGWWYGWCGVSNLNGHYFDTGVNLEESMHWFPWFRIYKSLKSTRMLVRKI